MPQARAPIELPGGFMSRDTWKHFAFVGYSCTRGAVDRKSIALAILRCYVRCIYTRRPDLSGAGMPS